VVETLSRERSRLVHALAAAGSVNPAAEADALLDASKAKGEPLEELLTRRLAGEPLAWITGWARFCRARVRVDPGVFVPRPLTESLARRAVALLPADGIAIDLCTGSGAVALVLSRARPRATVIATDIDPAAAACARRNGVEALLGDLDEPLPRALRGRVDVVTAVVPYVPTEELHLLPRDVIAHEPRGALDGGPRGTVVLERAAGAAARWLRPGGSVLLELGGDQADELSTSMSGAGLTAIRVHRDEEGRDRAIEARRPDRPSKPRARVRPVPPTRVRKVSDREERVARNEATSREINEALEQAHEGAPSDRYVRMVCECGLATCDRMIAITTPEYERVRSDPRWFAVLREHVVPDAEVVVEAHDRFVVVVKREGTPAEIAEQQDPRS
jgi:release factor glutamine methyltransferase